MNKYVTRTITIIVYTLPMLVGVIVTVVYSAYQAGVMLGHDMVNALDKACD